MLNSRNIWVMVVMPLTIVSVTCLDPYKPPQSSKNVHYLVVDGFLNASDSTCTIVLTRTIPLDTTTVIPGESHASVDLINDAGDRVHLSEGAGGVYSARNIIVDKSKNYWLSIFTSDKNSYQSDAVPVLQTPPIDSINWKLSAGNLSIYANTHDFSTPIGYYRWKFTETWQYHSFFRSFWQVDAKGHVSPRTDNIYDCYATNSPQDIRIGSTASLSENRISEFPLVTFSETDLRLQTKYSIIVEQRSLTAEFYNYAEQLKKTTESLGTLFDPLPSTVFGNIHSLTNSAEFVVGYFSAGTVSKQRIFILKRDVDPLQKILANSPYYACKIDTVLTPKDIFPDKDLIPFDAILSPDGTIVFGYYSSTLPCIDCRLLGGTNVPPTFW